MRCWENAGSSGKHAQASQSHLHPRHPHPLPFSLHQGVVISEDGSSPTSSWGDAAIDGSWGTTSGSEVCGWVASVGSGAQQHSWVLEGVHHS